MDSSWLVLVDIVARILIAPFGAFNASTELDNCLVDASVSFLFWRRCGFRGVVAASCSSSMLPRCSSAFTILVVHVPRVSSCPVCRFGLELVVS